MSIVNRWGTDRVQENFFKRQVEFRRTLDKLLHGGGGKIIADNMLHFKMSNTVKSVEDMMQLVVSRYVQPVMLGDGIILPQIIGVNATESICTVYSYAPILKDFNGKVAGLVDVLMMLLGNKKCDFCAFVTGSRGGKQGPLAVIAAYDLVGKTMLRRAFNRTDSGISECQIPLDLYEEIFSRTFDSDIWTSDQVWSDAMAN